MQTPRGAILETTRMVVSREVTRDETGRESVRTLTVSGAAILVTLKEGSDAWQKFRTYTAKHGLAIRVVETTMSVGTFNPHGKQRQTGAEVPHVVQVIGCGEAFLRLPFKWFVADWDNILNVQPPRGGSSGYDGHSRTPGDASPRVKRECRMRRMPFSAQQEADRREMRTAPEKERDRMAEFAELPRTDARRFPDSEGSPTAPWPAVAPTATAPARPTVSPAEPEPAEDTLTQELLRLPAFKGDPKAGW